VFKASGCQLITRSSLTALAKNNCNIHTLSLVGCESLYDTDFGVFHRCLLTNTLTNLDLSGCVNLSDKGVAVLIRALGVHVDTPENAAQNTISLDDITSSEPDPATFSTKYNYRQMYQSNKNSDSGAGKSERSQSGKSSSKDAGAQEDDEEDFERRPSSSRHKKFASPFDKWGPDNYKSAKARARELKAQRDKFIAEREAKARREEEIAMRGCRLVTLTLVGCDRITDFSATIIGTLCGRLRELNLSRCTLLTDETVHTLARKVTGLTTLKLDSVPRITARALISHTTSSTAAALSTNYTNYIKNGSSYGIVEFADMAKQWIGYQPKPGFQQLMELKVQLKKKNMAAILIQAAIRRKFAYKVYKIRRKAWMISIGVPKIQSAVRGFLQRKKFKAVRFRLYKIHCAIRIQQAYRVHLAYKIRMQLVKEKRFLTFKDQVIVQIQRVYRGMKGRMRVQDARNVYANKRLRQARTRARRELMAIRIQLNFRVRCFSQNWVKVSRNNVVYVC
jgi:hypothetical protein